MFLSATEYVELNLGKWIVQHSEFSGLYEVISSSVKESDGLNGFMARILLCEVVLKGRKSQQLVNN